MIPTLSSSMKQRAPVAYAAMLRKVTTRMQDLQAELAAESATNLEFEEQSRKSFEFLAGQVRALKDAFNTLTDAVLQDLESIQQEAVSEVRNVRVNVDARFDAANAAHDELKKELHAFIEDQGARHRTFTKQSSNLDEQMNQVFAECDAVGHILPNIEEKLTKLSESEVDIKKTVTASLENVDLERQKTASTLERWERRDQAFKHGMEEKLQKLCSMFQTQMEQQSRYYSSMFDDLSSRIEFNNVANLGGAAGGKRSPSEGRTPQKPTGLPTGASFLGSSAAAQHVPSLGDFRNFQSVSSRIRPVDSLIGERSHNKTE